MDETPAVESGDLPRYYGMPMYDVTFGYGGLARSTSGRSDVDTEPSADNLN